MKLALACSLILLASAVCAAPPHKDLPAPDLAGYQKWAMANPRPVKMNEMAAMMCAGPPAYMTNGPHAERWARVFVNPAGRAAMFRKNKTVFPVGTVLVKQKLPRQDGGVPELLTVMVKRNKGFNPACGDWEFFVTDGTGKQVTSRGKIGTCMKCHNDGPTIDQDHTYRLLYAHLLKGSLN